MSILESESGLTTQQYTDIQAAIGDLAASVVLQRYGPVWTEHDTEGARSGEGFDAAVAGDYLLRAYVGSYSDLEVERLADESGGDEVWASVATGVHSDIDDDVAPSLVTDGVTARVFYYSGSGDIEYIECTDISDQTFGAAQTVGTVANVIFLAAVSTTKLYYITLNANRNRVLHVYEFNESWSSTESDIYWPYPIHAFDAITFETGRDLLTLATDLPPLIGSRVVGAEVTQEVTRVQGIVTFWVANGRWSDHAKIDVIDRLGTDYSWASAEAPSTSSLFRKHLRQTMCNGLLFTSYLRRGGTKAHPYSKAAFVRSADGQNWEFPELIEGLTPPYAILARSDYLYAVGIDKVYRSPCCALAGQTPVEYDLTSYILGLESTAAEIRNSQVQVSNPADVLDGTLATSNDRLQALYKLGYVVDGTDLLMQVSLEDVVERAEQTALPRRGLALSTRDFLGRVNRVRSDYAAEWPGMQAGRDTFNDPSGTGYGGLRHMAPYKPSWKTPGGEEIHLTSKNKEGLVVSTFVTDALNGSAEVAFQVNTASNGEYAGIAFRTFDKDNLHFFIYDEDTDKLQLVKGVGTDTDNDDERDDTVLVSSNSVMSWAVDTWYWLKVVVRYSLVYAFYSTDGITWTAVTWNGGTDPIELAGQGAWHEDNPCVMSGRFGLIGYGYSADDSYPPYDPIPWIPPVPPPPILDEPDIVYVRVDDSAVWRTGNWPDDPPTWVDVTAALTGIKRICIDQVNRYVLVVCTDGIYRGGIDTASPAWVQILDADDLPASVAIGPFAATTWKPGSVQISRNGYLGSTAMDANACGCAAYHPRRVLLFMPPGGSGKGDLIVAQSDYACGANCCPVHTGENYWRQWRANMSIRMNTFRFSSGCGNATTAHYIHGASAEAGAAVYNMSNEGATSASAVDELGDIGGNLLICRWSNAGAGLRNHVFSPGQDRSTWTDITPATGAVDNLERDANIDGHIIGRDINYVYHYANGAFSQIVKRTDLAIGAGHLGICTCYYDDIDQLFLAITTANGTGYVLTTRNRGTTWTNKRGVMGDLEYEEIRPVWTEAPT